MFRRIRIALLIFILATVAVGSWRMKARATDWRSSLQVAIYPVSADDSPVTAAYVQRLSEESFEDIETWVESESRRYGLSTLRPVDITLAQPGTVQPPPPPQSRNPLAIALWSLHLRWWTMRNDQQHKPTPQVKLYVIFHDPARALSVPHSLGLEKGMIGVVHAFASNAQRAQNNVVIAHELLHTLGASDKYAAGTNMPLHPVGYAEPERIPLYPQTNAEIMAGRYAVSEHEARMPDDVFGTVIGPATAREIRWRN